MRVGTSSLYQGIQHRLLSLSADLKTLNEKIASGKRLNRPSDDPLATIEMMELKTATAQFDQYSRSLQRAASWVNRSESALSQTLDLVARAQEIAVQMASDSQSGETRAMAATEVGHLLDQAISLANTQLGGKYIFAGYATDSAPFTKVTVGGIDTAQYNGDTNDFQLPTGREETIVAGRNGQTVFMDSTLFETLGNLKKALEDNDSEAIRSQLENLRTVGNYLDQQMADVGARGNRVEVKQGAIQSLQADILERLSQVEDTDLAGAILQLKARELTYQAAMAVAARIHELTLLDYIR